MTEQSTGLGPEQINPFHSHNRVQTGEDAVRALLVVASALGPLRLRAFVRDTLLAGSDLRTGYRVCADSGILFDLAFPRPRSPDLHTPTDAVVVGLTYGAPIRVDYDVLDQYMRDTVRRGVPDARVVDPANRVTIYLESQKGDWQSSLDLARHVSAVFASGTPSSDVYRGVGWDAVLSGLRRVVEDDTGADGPVLLEVYLVNALSAYLADLGVVREGLER